MKNATIFFSILIFAACSKGPAEIHFGHDECAFCRMIISEAEFGSQLRTTKGMRYKFDSIECLAAFEFRLKTDPTTEIHKRWVPDFPTRNWVEASEAAYLHSNTLRSPMGLFLSAYQNADSAEEYRLNYQGEILEWGQVIKLVLKEWKIN